MRRGIYRYVRHPIYLGISLTIAGWLVLWAAPVTTTMAIVATLLIFRRRIRIEEAMMLERFGDDYRAYMQQTWRLVPGL
jgi:protein-S-isoprenylcysteine O-methyltransferase Ste14